MTTESNNRPFSLALIGANGFGSYHRAAIDTLSREGRIRLAAVVDPALKSMPVLAAELLGKGVRLYPDYQRFLDLDEGCDAVTIAAPIPYHYEIATRCIERDIPIYLEKPPVPLLRQLDTLVELDRNRRVFVGFQHLSYAWMRRLKGWVVEGRFGELKHIRAGGCWPRTDVYYNRCDWSGKMTLCGRPVFDGPATNALAHLIHNIMYLASVEPGGFCVPSEVRGELYRARLIESYDVASLCGSFDSGVQFSLALTHATEIEHPFTLIVSGTKGWARLSSNGSLLESSFAGCEAHPQPAAPDVLRESYSLFSDFVDGRLQRPDTTLGDCRGYTIATNSMLLSSGGIHDIPRQCIQAYTHGGRNGYAVTGLAEAVSAVLAKGGTFSDLDMPWAVATDAVSRDCIEAVDLLPHLARSLRPDAHIISEITEPESPATRGPAKQVPMEDNVLH